MSDTSRLRQFGVTVAVVVSLVAAGPLVASAATDGSIVADPATPDSTAAHTATVTVDGDAVGSSLNSLAVSYGESGTDISNVGQGDVRVVGIDRGDDADGASVDESVADDVSSVGASDDGSTLTVGFGGNYQLQQGDEVVLVFEDTQNPASAGDYPVELTVNAQSAGTTTDASLAVAESAGDDSDDDCVEQTDA
ncbi:hypothetical protein EGH21_12980 [Halomicroarcula sp. F13]|uniref:DUF1102 domain-containing protein n=1 Tax=Haloarcula rubra TaxID=2487747 RepID=A0AAW4PTS0_9EURY|nr:hypothetical protein [Halomicroarcula rubra]MBX0323945.1 hypothetical protein [Halomicroarcula rubra]